MQTAMDIDKFALEQFQKADELFKGRIQNEQLMCKIFSSYAGPEDANHNCLGCNFNELTGEVSSYLFISGQTMFSLSHSLAVYVFLLNVIWERMSDVFNIVSLPEGYLVKHYGTLIRARRWANFFKHPKEFGWLVHHPVYTICGSNHHKADHVYINEEFIKKYYARDGAKGLSQEFQGKERKVIVVLPDIVELRRGSESDKHVQFSTSDNMVF